MPGPYGLPSDGFLRRREVADDLVLPDRVDHQFVWQATAFGGVELDRLVDTLVLLFGELVVRHHLNRVPVLLDIGILEKQRDIAETLRLLGLAELDIDVIALAQALEGGQ